MLRNIALWIDERLHLSKLFDSTAGHTVPANAGSWFYVFGSGTLTCFVLQIVTGICLAFVYVPSADEAYTTLEYLNFQQPLGWYLRALHFWGSNFMVGIMAIHMTQVFLFGAFKYPRELTWISGCALLLLTLGMAFTGQIMRFDQDAYWGLGIGAAIMGRMPLIGPNLVHLLLGGPIFHAARLCHSWTVDCAHQPAPATGVGQGDQRISRARPGSQKRIVRGRIRGAAQKRRRAVLSQSHR